MKKMILLLFLIVLCLMAVSCQSRETTAASSQLTSTSTLTTTQATDTIAQATLNRYRTNEIREYQGVRLDPAVGPRDNSITGSPTVELETYHLVIDGLVGQTAQLTYEAVRQLPVVERKITLHCVEGWDATILWRGVQFSELFKQVNVKPEANTVIFHCYDGYTTSLPLATIIEKQLILAYDANGLPLPTGMGYPFIVVAEDRYGYKWARWVTRIELSADSGYRGYWESFGYDNQALLD